MIKTPQQIRNEKKEKVLGKIKNVLFILLLIFAFVYLFNETINQDHKCIEEGYDGVVTMFFIPTSTCYIDNRPNSKENIDYFPLQEVTSND